jgi:hypothetical protein
MKSSLNVPGLLFLSFFFFFATVTPLGQVVSDTAYSVETAKSLFYRHTFAIEKNWELRFAEPGRGGRYYSKFGLGYALSFLPQIAIAHLLSSVIPLDRKYIEQTVISFTNTVYAACTAVALFVLMSILGYRRRRALVTVVCIAASSVLLPYSKIIQSETMTAFMLVLFLIMAASDRFITPRRGFVLGIIYAMLYFIKPVTIIFGSVIGLYVVIRFFQKRATVAGVAAFCCMAALPLAAIFSFNWYRFGSIVRFGYGEQQFQFSTPIFEGLAGFLFAPSKSMFLFSPLLVFCLMGFKGFYERHRHIALCIGGIGILYLILFSKWFDWKGGWAWGPRLIVPAIVIMHVVLVEFIDREKIKRSAVLLFGAVMLVSTGVQFLGSMVSYQQVHYFCSGPFSIKNSQIEVAEKLFMHKIQGKKEQYPCEMFHLNCDSIPYERDGKLFGGKVLSFDDKETFQGFATLWSGLSHNFGWRVCGYIPLFLLIISAGCGWRVYCLLPEEKEQLSSSI